MKKALKELLEHAPVKLAGDFSSFIAIPNGRYKGFWGDNGYDNIILLGLSCEDERWYKISEYVDIFDIESIRYVNIDIPHEYGVPRIWFRQPIHIDYRIQISSVSGKGKE